MSSIIGGLIVLGISAMIGWLAWLQNMPWFLIPLSFVFTIGLILFTINQWKQRWRKKDISKYSDKKIEKMIREWIDIPGFAIERMPSKPNIKFNFLMIYKNTLKINIVHDIESLEIIELLARVKISPHDHPFNEFVLKKISGKIRLEMARLGIEYIFEGLPNRLESISLRNPVILDESLTKYYFRQRILFILRAMILVIEIINQTADEAGLLTS